MHDYEFTFALDLGKAIPEVGSFCDRVSHHLSTMGHSERLSIESEMLRMTMQSPTPLTEGEQQMIAGKTLEALKESMPRFDFRCVSIRRKSGESRSQSHRNAE